LLKLRSKRSPIALRHCPAAKRGPRVRCTLQLTTALKNSAIAKQPKKNDRRRTGCPEQAVPQSSPLSRVCFIFGEPREELPPQAEHFPAEPELTLSKSAAEKCRDSEPCKPDPSQHADEPHADTDPVQAVAQSLDSPPASAKKKRFFSCPLPLVPCTQLQLLFTPLSRFFSSFVHTTCLLSVFRPYLALRESYPAFSAQIPMNATRQSQRKVPAKRIQTDTGLSPFLVSCSKEISVCLDGPRTTLQNYNSDRD